MEFDFKTIDEDHTKRDTFFALAVLFLCGVLWYMPTGFEADTAHEKSYVKARVLEVDNSNILDFGVIKQGQQEVDLEVLEGEFEGQKISSTNVLVGDIQIDYSFQPGDRVLAEVGKGDDGSLKWVDIVGPDRLRMELVLTVIFAVLLLVVGGLTGFKAMISFIFAVLLIWKVLIPCSLNRHDPVLVGLAVVGVLTLVINLLVGGLNRKGVIAFLGGMSGILLTCALALLFSPSFSLSGAVRPFAKTLLLKVSGDMDINRIFIAGIFIACSGAVMDLAMDISAALIEIKKHNPTIRFRPLLLSGLRVGRAVIGTMTTTLLLAYSGGYITMLMYFMAQGLHPKVVLNSSFLSAEILNTLIGSFGLVTVAPFTAIMGSLLLCWRKEDRSCAAAD